MDGPEGIWAPSTGVFKANSSNNQMDKSVRCLGQITFGGRTRFPLRLFLNNRMKKRKKKRKGKKGRKRGEGKGGGGKKAKGGDGKRNRKRGREWVGSRYDRTVCMLSWLRMGESCEIGLWVN